MKFMAFIWSTYLSPQFEYCSPIYYPTTYGEVDMLEGVMRMWTRQIPVISQYHFWDRLKLLHFSSIQQRVERYAIIAYKKVVSGDLLMVEGFKLKETRFGVEAELPWSPARAPK